MTRKTQMYVSTLFTTALATAAFFSPPVQAGVFLALTAASAVASLVFAYGFGKIDESRAIFAEVNEALKAHKSNPVPRATGRVN